MPLIYGYSDKSIAENIKSELEHGKSHAQAIAIALDIAAKAKDEADKEKRKRNEIQRLRNKTIHNGR
jgi:hypothetical protein